MAKKAKTVPIMPVVDPIKINKLGLILYNQSLPVEPIKNVYKILCVKTPPQKVVSKADYVLYSQTMVDHSTALHYQMIGEDPIVYLNLLYRDVPFLISNTHGRKVYQKAVKQGVNLILVLNGKKDWKKIVTATLKYMTRKDKSWLFSKRSQPPQKFQKPNF